MNRITTFKPTKNIPIEDGDLITVKKKFELKKLLEKIENRNKVGSK